MTQRQIAIYWLWAVSAFAVLFILFGPAPEPSNSKTNLPASEEKWAVPHLPPSTTASADLAELSRSNLWGGQNQAESQADERSKQWRLAGLAGQSKDRHVLVQFGDDRIMPLKAGDRFPDGTLIAEIKDNGVCVQIDGKKRLLPLPGQAIPIIW
jgi:hypothetical protein